MPKAKKTYTVHAHVSDRHGRTHSYWTRTGLTKTEANRLAAEQRREEGGRARVVSDPYEPPRITHHAPRKSTGRRRTSKGRRRSSGGKAYKALRRAFRKSVGKRRASRGRRR